MELPERAIAHARARRRRRPLRSFRSRLALGAAIGGAALPWRALAHEPAAHDDEAGADTILVQGTPRDPIVASSTQVSAREFSATPRRSAEDALRLVPGVTVVQHGSEGKGYQILVRGFDAQHGSDFEVSVDGIPLNEWSNVHAQGYIDLGLVIPELVTAVRVTKGPFTLEQGAFAMAGSADYHLGITPDDRGLRASYTLGTTNRHRGVVSYSPAQGTGHDFVASETLYDEGFGTRRTVSKGTLLARTDLLRSERLGSLSILAGASVARFELPGALRADDFAAGRIGFRDSYDATSHGKSLRALTALSYEKASGRHRLRAIAYGGLRRLDVLENFTGFLFDRRQGDARAQHQDTASFGLSLALTSRLLPALDVNLGLGLRGDVLSQEQWHVGAAEQRLERERALDALQALTHARAGLTLEPLDSVRLDAGVRVDVAHVAVADELALADDTGTLPAVSPRVVLEWRMLQSLRLLAAYGRGFRPPEARSFTSFEPVETGLTEDRFRGGEAAMTTSDSFEVGTRYRMNEHFFASLSAFATFVARESVYDHVSGINVELNGTRRLGGELSLRSDLTDFLALSADATVLDARFVESNALVPLAPTLFGGARAVLGRARGWRGGLRFLAVAPRPLPHGAKSSALTQVDASAGYHFAVWRLDLEVENLLNQRIREGEYHFASHWQRSLPASSIPSLHYVPGPPLNARLTVTAVF